MISELLVGNNSADLNRKDDHNYNVILVEQDHYLPVFSEVLDRRCDEVAYRNVKNICYKILENVIMVLKIYDYRHLILLNMDVIAENTYKLCQLLKKELQMKTENGFSVVILRELTKTEETMGLYYHIKRIVNQKYFFCSTSVLNLTYFHEIKEQIGEFDIDRIEKAAQDMDFDSIFFEMDKRFTVIVKRMDYEAFSIVIRQLIELLKKWDKKLIDLQSAEVFQVYEKGDEENWYLIVDSIHWIKRKYKKMEQMILNNEMKKYSIEVMQVIQFIYKNYQDCNLRSEFIAKAMNISENQLNDILKVEVGSTINKFLTNYRIEKARELLVENKTKISNIHKQIGYKTPQYFSRVFKKESGITPMEYKKRNKS